MAKRKNSTALFEVMAAHRAKQQAQAAASSTAPAKPAKLTSIPTPTAFHAPPAGHAFNAIEPKLSLFAVGKKWLVAVLEKRRAEAAAAAAAAAATAAAATEAADPGDPTAGVTAHSLAARANATAATPAATIESQRATADTTDAIAPAATGPVTYTTVMPTYGRSSRESDASASRSKPVNKVAFDRDKHEVTLKVRFTTAAISVFALLVVVGVAYIVGKRTGAPTVKAPAPKNNVLDVASDKKPVKAAPKPPAGDATLVNSRTPGRTGRDATAGAQPNAAPGNGTAVPQVTPAAVFEDTPIVNGAARRTIGLNYCVIQQFSPEFQEVAMEVSEFLNANGVPNTIELGSSKTHTRPGWYIVVGVRGFGKVFQQTPEYIRYAESIASAAGKFPQKSKLNKPQIMPVRWDE